MKWLLSHTKQDINAHTEDEATNVLSFDAEENRRIDRFSDNLVQVDNLGLPASELEAPSL